MSERKHVTVRIQGIVSMPRLGFVDYFESVIKGVTALGIDFKRHSGAYWEQCLSRLLEDAIDAGFDYAVTMDYDSVFTAKHVARLIRLMAEFDDADVIHATQIARDRDLILCCPESNDTAAKTCDASKFAGELTPSLVGHFGLTCIRLKTLARVPHPWLHGQPNAEGRWRDGKIDADVRFWDILRKAGGKAFQANKVRIGHAWPMIAWPDENLNPVFQPYIDYQTNGPLVDMFTGRVNIDLSGPLEPPDKIEGPAVVNESLP